MRPYPSPSSPHSQKKEKVVEIQSPSREQCTFWYDRLYPEVDTQPCSPTFRGLHLKKKKENIVINEPKRAGFFYILRDGWC